MKKRDHRSFTSTLRRRRRPRPDAKGQDRALARNMNRTKPKTSASHGTGPGVQGKDPTAGYACTKCGYCADLQEPDWFDPQIPTANVRGRKPEGSWSLCPDDGGPDSGVLVAPNRQSARFRSGFLRQGKVIRACTPYVVMGRDSERRVTLGAVLSQAQIWREIVLKNHLEQNGPDTDIDLQRLDEASTLLSPLRCSRVGDWWALPYMRTRPHDDWANKAMRVLRDRLGLDSISAVNKLAEALEPRMRISDPPWSRVLFVPFDIRQPIEAQMQRVHAILTEIRTYLYRFTRRTPPRDRSRTLWRDVYIYVLAEVAGWPVSQIGAEVFPQEPKRSRELKVRQALRKVVAAAGKAGFSFAKRDKLSPPA